MGKEYAGLEDVVLRNVMLTTERRDEYNVCGQKGEGNKII